MLPIFLGTSCQIHLIISSTYAKMETHKRKPLLSRITWHYIKFLVLSLPLRTNTPKKFLKRQNGNYLVFGSQLQLRNKKTQLFTLVLPITYHATLANHLTALDFTWKTEIGLCGSPHGTVRIHWDSV